MLPWTDEQRAKVHPFRGEQMPLPDDDEGVRRLVDFWTQREGVGDVTQMTFWTRGVEYAGTYAERLRAAIDIFDNPDSPAKDPDVEACMLVMLDYWSRRSIVIKRAQGGANDRYGPVDAWFVRRWLAVGLPFALHVLAAFPRLDVDMSRAGQAETHTLVIKARDGDPKWWCLEVGHLGLLHVLRRAAAIATDYAAGVAEAVRIRENAPLFLRAGLAFVFPDEPFWQHDARDAAPKKKGRYAPESWGLVTTRIDEATIPAILDSMARDGQPFVTDTALYGYTLVHRFGDEAAKHLLAYLSVVRDAYGKEHFARALALTDTKETREFFAANIKHKTLGKIAKAYAAS